MIVVQTSVPLDPDHRTEALRIVQNLVERSRDEPGTIDYHATTDVEDPNVVRFFERYEDVAAAEAHTESEEYRAFVDALPDLVDGQLETVQFELDEEPAVFQFDAEEAR